MQLAKAPQDLYPMLKNVSQGALPTTCRTGDGWFASSDSVGGVATQKKPKKPVPNLKFAVAFGFFRFFRFFFGFFRFFSAYFGIFRFFRFFVVLFRFFSV